MKNIIHIFLLLGLLPSAHGRDISIPTGYLTNKSADKKCSLLKLPRRIAGTEICIYNASLEEAAIQSGLFENEQGHWVLSGPGVPNLPIIEKNNLITLMHGVAICAIENETGLHGAGGRCFYGASSTGTFSLTFRSRPTSSNMWDAKNLDSYNEMMRAFSKQNLESK
jgi:hypothetical protein